MQEARRALRATWGSPRIGLEQREREEGMGVGG